MHKREVTQSQKKAVAGKQHHKCKNEPGANLEGLTDYKCPLWTNSETALRGCFDESSYEIDHIVEHSVSHDDSDSNLQALCKSCHAVKTSRFMRNHTKQTDTKSPKTNSNVLESPKASKTKSDNRAHLTMYQCFDEFIRTTRVCTNNSDDFEQISALYIALGTWHSDTFNYKCPYTRAQLIEHLMTNGFEVDKGHLHQYKLRVDLDSLFV